LKNAKKIMQYSLNYSGARFLSTEIKITQFPGGFRLNFLHPLFFTRDTCMLS